MIGKLILIFYIVVIAPVIGLTLIGLTYGGVMEFIKWYHTPTERTAK